MTGERKLIRKVFLGLAAALISVAIIRLLNRGGFYIAWAPIIPAALIGAAAGLAEKSVKKMAFGIALGCIGWICGELFSRLLFHSVATWVFVGAFIGLTAGLLEKSPKSVIGGFLLGAVGGFMGVAAGMSTIMFDPLRNLDMQATSILSAGLFISLLLGLKRSKGVDVVVGPSTGNNSQETPEEE